MKHKVMKLASFIVIAFSVITILSVAGCAKAGIGGPSYTIDGAADGTQVVPASSSTAIGLISGSFDGSKNTLNATIKWTGLSGPPTAIHIHNGPIGRANSYPQFIMQNIPKGITDSITFKSPFTESQETGVKSDLYYFDIHTAAYPDGEIRGQLLAH
ncbi:MAG: CHRD domain-containing protein [Chitinophagaceae bacterium]